MVVCAKFCADPLLFELFLKGPGGLPGMTDKRVLGVIRKAIVESRRLGSPGSMSERGSMHERPPSI